MDIPETRYAKAADGVSVAYHVVGDGPIDLIWLHAFMGSLEVLWESELIRSITNKLASFARVIRHDMRATGLSSRATELPDLKTQVRDALAVLDDVGSRSTVIFGAGPDAHAASLFAATYPARSRSLVLWDLYAWAGTAFELADLELLTRTWGTEAAAAAAMARVARRRRAGFDRCLRQLEGSVQAQHRRIGCPRHRPGTVWRRAGRQTNRESERVWARGALSRLAMSEGATVRSPT